MLRSTLKAVSIFLGVLMFTFGFLKFFRPISGWFDVQIQQSHLPHAAILVGKLGEMATGILFLLARIKTWDPKEANRMLLAAYTGLFVEMMVAVYVHLQPNVPPSVLPLGIKPPVIPLVVMAIGGLAAMADWRVLGSHAGTR